MNLVRRRQGQRGLVSLQDAMNDLFDRFFEVPAWPTREGAWAPALDVLERDDAVVVKADLPGMTAEDIDLHVHGDVLTLSGEKSEQTEDKADNYYRMERRSGSFSRAITLPASVDPEKIEANYRDGVLTVTLPKTETAKERKIKIQS